MAAPIRSGCANAIIYYTYVELFRQGQKRKKMFYFPGRAKTGYESRPSGSLIFSALHLRQRILHGRVRYSPRTRPHRQHFGRRSVAGCPSPGPYPAPSVPDASAAASSAACPPGGAADEGAPGRGAARRSPYFLLRPHRTQRQYAGSAIGRTMNCPQQRGIWRGATGLVFLGSRGGKHPRGRVPFPPGGLPAPIYLLYVYLTYV